MWDDEKSMRTFVAQAPHRQVMPKLTDWCDEASVANWVQVPEEMPDWDAAAQQMLETGRLLRVAHPSEAQMNGRMNVT